MRFSTWAEAFSAAQKRANETGLSVGIEKAKEYGIVGYNVRFIPAPKYRFGCDARCEAVEPTKRRRNEKAV